jgi:hypothetical protein
LRRAAWFAGAVGVSASGALVAVGACIAGLPSNVIADAGATTSSDAESGVMEDAGSGPDARGASACGNGTIDLDAGEQCDPGATPAMNVTGACTAACRVDCVSPAFRWPNNNHCYWLAATDNSNFSNAQSLCFPGHIVTFASETEFDAVEANVRFSKADPRYWIDMTTLAGRSYPSLVPYEPGWDPTCSGCYAHTPDPSMPLPRYVDSKGVEAGGPCISADTDPVGPSWSESACTGIGTLVVCESEPVGAQFSACGDAGVCIDLVATHARKRYVYRSSPATADSAEAFCTSLGGRLVVLQSRDEREQLWFQLSKIAGASAIQRVWIGLSLKMASSSEGGAGDGVWAWDDGIPATAAAYPSPWGDREPIDAGTTSRAYMRAYMGVGEIDNTLARNDEAVKELPFVCELADGGP